MKNLFSNLNKQQLMILGILCLLLFIVPVVVWAQPGLPSDPEQAPIGGGLGILAAMGGSYAIMKLRGKNKE